MKRILACLIAAACLLTAFALAEGPTMTMKVIKCKQAVNLRRSPSTDSDSLGLVPLGTELTGCSAVEGSDWIAVNYQGVDGFIRNDFLEMLAVEEPEAEPEEEVDLGPIAERELPAEAPIADIAAPSQYTDDMVILDETVGGVHVIARRIYMEANEYLLVVGLDGNGAELWRKQTMTPDVTEMTQTDALIGGTADAPSVLMYNDWLGLSALDPATGAIRWEVTKQDVFLGGSVSRVVGPDGTLYIGGYYGPDPVAISADGRVLWQADCSAYSAQWMTTMELLENGISCWYGSMKGDEGETTGTVVYDFNGAIAEVIFD